MAYVYAFLAFLCTILKAEADVQHLWFGSYSRHSVTIDIPSVVHIANPHGIEDYTAKHQRCPLSLR
ncbi:hypothetical protein L210DRAFT_3650922 [Boletus edulis BED1]|uniref:Uncharacterized protein n=1 Tax=Boletus edulis BED1 TaxID=1328754 RepID=A0AAD4G995_BOLED|nr:hypothetical protein L210DRAFT_3650922 [Boletus edulis BED1]